MTTHNTSLIPTLATGNSTSTAVQNAFRVSAIHGRGCPFSSIPHRDRLAVIHLDGAATCGDLLSRVLDVFGLEDGDHLAEIRIPMTRKRTSSDAQTWPTRRSDLVYTLWEDEMSHDPWDDSDTPLANLVSVGDVFYLRFDYGDEWWWRCQFVAADLAGPVEDELSPLMFFQYDYDCNGKFATRRA